jgi:hypothetical protein
MPAMRDFIWWQIAKPLLGAGEGESPAGQK